MMTRTQILLPQATLIQLRQMAAMQKTSVSQITRTLLDNQLKKTNSKKMTGVEALMKMAKNAYKGPGPTDLSTNDDYLYKLP